MKTFAISLVFALAASSVFAQDRISERKTLSRTLDEIYQVPVNNRKVKDGSYEVRDEKERILVKGTYDTNRKTGVWTYYDNMGTMVQQYDFTNHKIVFSAFDSTSIVHSQYQVLDPADETDTVTPPMKIGGVNYGFYLLFDIRDIPSDVKGVTSEGQRMTYIFTVSETGQLEGWTIIYGGKQVIDVTQKKSIKGLPTDAYEFVPATLNGKPVKSKITYWVSLDVNHSEIQGTNNIITQHPESN